MPHISNHTYDEITLACEVYNQQQQAVVTGTAEVMAPRDKLTLEAPVAPLVQIEKNSRG